jgi:hypothetical protein
MVISTAESVKHNSNVILTLSLLKSYISYIYTSKNCFYLILFLTILVKPYGIPQCATITYVMDLIELLINGWPEDGLLEAETCSHPQQCI